MREINIPIHKHTPKRYRKSVWIIRDMFKIGTATLYATNMYNTPLVTDLQRVPKNRFYKMSYPDNKWVEVDSSYTKFHFSGDEVLRPRSGDKLIYPTKKLGFWRNLWKNKIRRGK